MSSSFIGQRVVDVLAPCNLPNHTGREVFLEIHPVDDGEKNNLGVWYK